MFNKIILKNFKSNLHNYILFFISNIVAVAEMIAFWGMNDIVTKAITDKVTAAALKMDFKIAAGLITVITVLLMVFSMKHYIQLRMKDYSTFIILGMRKRTSYLTRLCHFIKSKSSKNIVFINVFGRLIQNNTTYVNVPRRS